MNNAPSTLPAKAAENPDQPVTLYRKVYVRGLKLDAYIGVYEHEYDAAQPLVIDFEITVVEPDVPDSDRLEDVLCYNKFSEGIKSIIAAGHIKLIETLAERICTMALDHPMVRDICVRIDKQNAIAEADAAGVEVYRAHPKRM